MRKPNYIIVLNALMDAPGERTVELPDGFKVGWEDGKLHHIMYKFESSEKIRNNDYSEEVWFEYDISLNHFVKLCNRMTEEDIVGLIAGTVLQKHNATR